MGRGGMQPRHCPPSPSIPIPIPTHTFPPSFGLDSSCECPCLTHFASLLTHLLPYSHTSLLTSLTYSHTYRTSSLSPNTLPSVPTAQSVFPNSNDQLPHPSARFPPLSLCLLHPSIAGTREYGKRASLGDWVGVQVALGQGWLVGWLVGWVSGLACRWRWDGGVKVCFCLLL